jgi:DNA-binding MarR family transcriptional regulator
LKSLKKKEYVALSRFRFQLAGFLRFSDTATRTAGITPKQYLLLLHILGTPKREWASVGELARRLQSSAHGTVALVNRCIAAGLVRKHRNGEDARRVEVHLTLRGRRLAARIAARHRIELRSLHSFQVPDVS